jgi:signal transduction histidine kinase
MGVRTRTSLDIDDVIEGAHEGRLWVTADQGRGAIFHFTVPVDPGSPS